VLTKPLPIPHQSVSLPAESSRLPSWQARAAYCEPAIQLGAALRPRLAVADWTGSLKAESRGLLNQWLCPDSPLLVVCGRPQPVCHRVE